MTRIEINDGRFCVRTATPADAGQMEALQEICFPTLARHERLTAAHYANHIRVFPEGQLVIAEGEKIVASSGTLRMHFPGLQHTFLDATDNLWITNAHRADGEWLYQFDMGVLPACRGLGLSRQLYDAHHELVTALGMKGQITVGMTIGYAKYRDQFSIQTYCEKLKNQELTDPTVTPQRKAGFRWIAPIFNYVDDPAAGNCSILMVRPAEGTLPDELAAFGHGVQDPK